MLLIPIAPDSHGVELDLLYATTANFTGRAVYRRAGCYLNPEAEGLLRRATGLAARLGCRLRIYDAFRPAEAQWRLWAACPDPAYLADPRRGSPHSMGAAVDLTLIDAASGAALDMGTAFDDLRPQSWHGAGAISAEAERNRTLLLGIMTNAGFDFYRNEWWHYQLFNARARYPVLSDSVLAEGLM
jgi:D-alanyl-D-alanine dipeptidase